MSTGGARKCYVCKQAGHMSKDCPQATKTADAPSPKAAPAAPAAPAAAPAAPVAASAAASGSRKCYICGQAGHMSKDCTQAPKDGKSGFVKKASAAASSEEKSTFKERLAEYKAKVEAEGGAGTVKKNFCYACGKEGHRERDCPKNSKKKDEDKACLRCGGTDHIARYCPTIENRTVYRQENKERSKACYICDGEGHHATECPELEVLAEEFPKFVSKLDSGMKLNVKVYNLLLTKCARALELNGALYLWDQMQARNVAPNGDTYKQLEYLYDRSGKDHSKLVGIPQQKKRVHKLKGIVQAHRFTQKTSEVKDTVMTHLLTYLRANPTALAGAEKCASMFDLAKYLKTLAIPALKEQFSSASARLVLTTMKNAGRYHQKSKAAEFDLDGDFDEPGKFKKDAADAATPAGSKKKSTKKKSSKKKNKGKGEKKGEESKDADGDAEMTDASDEPAAKSTKKKKPTADAPAATAKPTKSKRKADDATAAPAEADDSKATSTSAKPKAKKAKKAA